ncbi:MAG: mannitol dehydrogenase family protein [Bifidobacteriaceae bacterium]|jgi:mannitol 2-dehydrogenase|nr:mannitol dehydrogenase family protein [Bifidobacteriaceae bacterium]
MAAPTRFGYDRSKVTPGIVHIGVGNFHRSHQAMYIDRLIGSGNGDEWGIWGIGLLPGDVAMRDALRSQDFTYTVLERHADGSCRGHTVRSILGMDIGPECPERVLARLAHPTTRIVSLTVTEGGYNISDSTGKFDPDNPAVRADLDPARPPTTVFRYLAEALRRRRDAGIAPFTVVSCDNLPGNGYAAKHSLSAFASLIDPELANWIAAEVAFPNSMVDRITPATTQEDRAMAKELFGVDDAWPVPAEPFTQWVLQDEFSCGRPPLETVGVWMTDDVGPYEHMKLRLLNGAHQALAYLGILLGHNLVHEAASDPRLVDFIGRYFEEAIPTLKPVAGIDIDAYTIALLERFANPSIKDTLARLALDASDRIPKFVLPVVADRLAAGQPCDISAAIVAAWARYSEAAIDPGGGITMNDRRREQIMGLAARMSTDPLGFLREESIFGDLANRPGFTTPYLRFLGLLRTAQVAGALQTLLTTAGQVRVGSGLLTQTPD